MEAALLCLSVQVVGCFFLLFRVQLTLSQSRHSKQQQVQPRCIFIKLSRLLTLQQAVSNPAASQSRHNFKSSSERFQHFFSEFCGVLTR